MRHERRPSRRHGCSACSPDVPFYVLCDQDALIALSFTYYSTVRGVMSDHYNSTANLGAVPHHVVRSAALCLAITLASHSTARAYPADESSHHRFGIPYAGPASRTDAERDKIYRSRASCHYLDWRSQVTLHFY